MLSVWTAREKEREKPGSSLQDPARQVTAAEASFPPPLLCHVLATSCRSFLLAPPPLCRAPACLPASAELPSAVRVRTVHWHKVASQHQELHDSDGRPVRDRQGRTVNMGRALQGRDTLDAPCRSFRFQTRTVPVNIDRQTVLTLAPTCSDWPPAQFNNRGMVAMANSGPDTNK